MLDDFLEKKLDEISIIKTPFSKIYNYNVGNIGTRSIVILYLKSFIINRAI